MASLKEEGMQKVKEEPGTGTTNGATMTTTTTTTNNDSDVRLKPATTMLPKPAPIAALPQPTAAAATAMASMFAGFPGGFNAAAFAKAAAAAFPAGLPKLAAAPPPPVMPSQAFGVAPTAASSTDKPATKRRKRGRAAEEGDVEAPPVPVDSVKPEGEAAVTAAAAGGCSPQVSTAGGPLAAAEQPVAAGVAISPQPEGTSAKGAWPSPAAGGAGGAGGTTISVLTPNLLNGDMSNQERKERRKIRNRMSAQQHRERQRQRVDTLEGCLRERDDEIARLRDQVASLASGNQQLKDRVRQLEELEAEVEVAVAGGADKTRKQQQQQQQHGHGTSSPQPFPRTAAGPAASGSFCCAHAAAAVAAAAAAAAAAAGGGKGSGGDTSDGGGITTEDQAHSSSSESDSDDLSPISSLDNRSGGPSTPPLSPTAAGGAANSSATTTSTAAAFMGAAAVATDVMVEFSLSAASMEMEGMAVDAEVESSLPPQAGALTRSFSRVAAAVAAGGGDVVVEGDGDVGLGPGFSPLPLASSLSTMEFSVPDSVLPAAAGAGAVQEVEAGIEAAPSRGAGEGGSVCTSGLLAFGDNCDGGSGGGGGSGSAAGRLLPHQHGRDADTGLVCEDELTMAALDPMEIDALLACAGDGVDGMGGLGVSDPFANRGGNSGGHDGGGGAASPSELEAGNSNALDAASSEGGGGAVAQPPGVPTHPGHLASGTDAPAAPAAGSAPGGAGASVATVVRGGGGLPSGDGGRRQTVGYGGGGVASTVAAGVMGALCLAGVVINSGAPAGGGSSSLGTALVPKSRSSPPSALVSSRRSGGGGARVLSADRGDGDDEDAEYANTTQSESWVFHPVEAEPWRWRATAARERRGPWVWEQALNLFGNAGVVADDPRGDTACDDDVVDVYSKATARSRFPPIAPPSAPLTNAPPSASEHGEGVISREPSGEPSGKELDLFYRDGELNGGFGRARGGVGAGGGRNGGGGSGDGRSGDRIRQGQHAGIVAGAGTTPGGLPSERTSYMFCPEAHGMMSGGMIERASKATYDHHHPGARPFPSAATGAGGVGVGIAGDGDEAALDGTGQVKVNVIDPRHHHDQQRQKERLRLPAAAGEEPADLSDPEASLAAAETRALVPSHASGNMRKLGKLDVDMDGGGVYFESARGGRRDVLSEGGDASNRPRRRGPTPIHGAVNSGPRGDFHESLRRSPSPDAEFLTMLVPSSALDWGPSTLAVRAALNGTAQDGSSAAGGGGGAGEAMSWVEIDCQILNARLVQDVSFTG